MYLAIMFLRIAVIAVAQPRQASPSAYGARLALGPADLSNARLPLLVFYSGHRAYKVRC